MSPGLSSCWLPDHGCRLTERADVGFALVVRTLGTGPATAVVAPVIARVAVRMTRAATHGPSSTSRGAFRAPPRAERLNRHRQGNGDGSRAALSIRCGKPPELDGDHASHFARVSRVDGWGAGSARDRWRADSRRSLAATGHRAGSPSVPGHRQRDPRANGGHGPARQRRHGVDSHGSVARRPEKRYVYVTMHTLLINRPSEKRFARRFTSSVLCAWPCSAREGPLACRPSGYRRQTVPL